MMNTPFSMWSIHHRRSTALFILFIFLLFLLILFDYRLWIVIIVLSFIFVDFFIIYLLFSALINDG